MLDVSVVWKVVKTRILFDKRVDIFKKGISEDYGILP